MASGKRTARGPARKLQPRELGIGINQPITGTSALANLANFRKVVRGPVAPRATRGLARDLGLAPGREQVPGPGGSQVRCGQRDLCCECPDPQATRGFAAHATWQPSNGICQLRRKYYGSRAIRNNQPQPGRDCSKN